MIDFNDFAYCISDEMLAAYIDGNATESEKSLIENSISDNFMLSETVDVANDAMLFGSDFDWDLHRGDYGFWELGLPPVLSEADYMVADVYDTPLNIGGEDLSDINNLDFSDSDVPYNIDSSNVEDLINPDCIGELPDIEDLSDTLLT